MKLHQVIIFVGIVCCMGMLNVGPGYGKDVGPQFMFGYTALDKDEIDFDDIADDINLEDIPDLSDLISFGGAGYHHLAGSDKLTLGVEYGGILSGMVDDVDTIAHNGKARVSFDTSLFLLDIFVGPQANLWLGERFRLYGGVGPLLMIGYISADLKEREIEEEYDIKVNESDTAVGVGGYARLGGEFVLGGGSSLGLGVRGFTAALDLDDTLGEVDFNGVQAFFTYTAKF
jgi:hypothetical protein